MEQERKIFGEREARECMEKKEREMEELIKNVKVLEGKMLETTKEIIDMRERFEVNEKELQQSRMEAREIKSRKTKRSGR